MAEKKKTTKKSAPKSAATKATKITASKEVVKTVETVKPAPAKKESKPSFLKEYLNSILIGIACLLLIACIILLVMGHKVKLADGQEVIASIKGKEYTAEELFEDLKAKYGEDSLINMIDGYIANKELSKSEKSDAKKEAQEYIQSIKQQYESSGYTWEEVLKNYGYANEDKLVDEYKTQIMVQKLVTKKISKDITDEEIKKYYDENVYDTYSAKHILIIPETSDDMSDEEVAQAEEDAKAKAQEVIDKYEDGEDWETLVTEYSEDEGSKESEGLVENFSHDDVDEAFFDAVAALKDDELTSEPVKSSFGYHVIIKVSTTAKPSLKDKKDDIIEALVSEKLQNEDKLYLKTLVSIRKKYKLDIRDTAIKSTYETKING